MRISSGIRRLCGAGSWNNFADFCVLTARAAVMLFVDMCNLLRLRLLPVDFGMAFALGWGGHVVRGMRPTLVLRCATLASRVDS